MMNVTMIPSKTHAPIADWLAYFEQNRLCRQPVIWEFDIQIEKHLREPLIRSLQRFQVGEQGDGQHLRTAAEATNDPAYSAAIGLFVQEEQEHSRMLAGLIRALDATLLEAHWSDTCFVLLRRLSGLRMELFTLLVAEIIAQVYYRVLHDGVVDPAVRAACAQILHDEDGHVAFHCDYLHADLMACSQLTRRLIGIHWHALFSLVCLVVIGDHFNLLHELHVSPRVFWQDCQRKFDEAYQRIFG